jgi:hypothetical protein
MRRKDEHLTWCQAFYKAYMSRGLRTTSSSLGSSKRNRTTITSMMAGVRAGMRKIIQIFQLATFEKMIAFTKSSMVRRSVAKEENDSPGESGGPAPFASPAQFNNSSTPPHRDDAVGDRV